MEREFRSFPPHAFPVTVLIRKTGSWTKAERETVIRRVMRGINVSYDARYPHVLALTRWQAQDFRWFSGLGKTLKSIVRIRKCKLVYKEVVIRQGTVVRVAGNYVNFDHLMPILYKEGAVRTYILPEAENHDEGP